MQSVKHEQFMFLFVDYKFEWSSDYQNGMKFPNMIYSYKQKSLNGGDGNMWFKSSLNDRCLKMIKKKDSSLEELLIT